MVVSFAIKVLPLPLITAIKYSLLHKISEVPIENVPLFDLLI